MLADVYYAPIIPVVTALRAEGKSLQEIADHLNDLGYKTCTGLPWGHVQVALVLKLAAR
jgi:hypothetical protein